MKSIETEIKEQLLWEKEVLQGWLQAPEERDPAYNYVHRAYLHGQYDMVSKMLNLFFDIPYECRDQMGYRKFMEIMAKQLVERRLLKMALKFGFSQKEYEKKLEEQTKEKMEELKKKWEEEDQKKES